MMSNDVLDILDLNPNANKKGFLNKDALLSKAEKKMPQKTRKRPQNIPRELWGLQNTFKNELPPLIPTDDSLMFKKPKVNLGSSKWVWAAFTNAARKDGLVLHHWRQKGENSDEYQFAKYDKHVDVPSFTDEEYTKHLTTPNWTLEKTRHLFELVTRFDMNFIHIQDRWDADTFSPRPSLDDIKERYYNILGILDSLRNTNYSQGLKYDANHERKRKKQLILLYGRTQEELDEEEVLSNQLKIIEARRREREKKKQDLENLIYQANAVSQDCENIYPNNTSSSNVNQTLSLKSKVKKRGTLTSTSSDHLGSTPQSQNPQSIISSLTNNQNEIKNLLKRNTVNDSLLGSPNLCLQDFLKTQGCHLRSQYLKTPQNIGQKKIRLLDNFISYMSLDQHPPCSAEIIKAFNSLRSNIILLFSLRSALITCDYEMISFKLKIPSMQAESAKDFPQDFLDDINKVDGNEESLNIDSEVLAGLKMANSKKVVIPRPVLGFAGRLSVFGPTTEEND